MTHVQATIPVFVLLVRLPTPRPHPPHTHTHTPTPTHLQSVLTLFGCGVAINVLGTHGSSVSSETYINAGEAVEMVRTLRAG